MLAFLVFGTVLVLLAGLLYFIKIRVHIRIIMVINQNQGLLDSKIAFWGNKKWQKQYHFPISFWTIMSFWWEGLLINRKQRQLPVWLSRLSTAQKIDFPLELRPIISRLLAAVHIKNLYWKTVYGGEDAMETALRTGSIWAVKGVFISILSSVSCLENMQISVTPDFHQQRLWSLFSGIFQMRLVHIILVGAHIIIWMVRGYWRGSTATRRKSVQSSHRGINENCYAEY
jgi:hypothetical protein